MQLGLRRARAKNAHRSLDVIMTIVGIVQPFALIPQIVGIYVDHAVQGVSLPTWALFTLFNALWAIYGLVHRDGPIMVAYILITLLDAIITVGILIY